jgi:Ni/Co efflux regulator RcnB
MRALLAGFLATAVLLSAAAAQAKNNKGHSPPGHAQGDGGDAAVDAIKAMGTAFTSSDRDAIRSYFVSNPGLAGSSLPPGIAKNYARGKPLPPGIAKKMLPTDLLVRLPQRPGYEYRIVGRDVVLVAIATEIVVDILIDVFS